ncbi:LOW QUALITY PROTEIN: solute carrier family 35 member G3-like [Anolis carolinensis]|uniref:EamA domain-containing protein n=1 Tax=Anolis carolinensis TaxID=28377 RepID=H9GL77_ANOCA|nr:PREDICTED: solute carrier family 35 member G3-like [Anolis carolinensis]|eukprot:XP_008120422.1 PREDICTED: solute carrier family 35 member G3-like [Anolis carolinensis]
MECDPTPPARAVWTVADLLRFSPPCSPPPPPRRPAWSRYRLSESMKGLLVALVGGGVPAGFVAPFTRMANEASGIPSLEILLFRCILHLLFSFYLCCRKASCFAPPEARLRSFLHAFINVISIGCAYSSFMVVPSGNAATVRKGSSTIFSVLLAICIGNTSLTGYDWFGLVGSTLGLIIMVVPDVLNLDKSTQLYDTFGYILACLGGIALALGLVIFRALDFPTKLVTVAFLFGVVGSLLCSPVMFLLQEPVMPVDLLTWIYVGSITILALVSFLCASYAVTKAHPALVCAVLHSEVVVTLAVQYYVLREAVTPFDIMGAGVILGSIAIITAQNISCDTTEEEDGSILHVKGTE